MNRKLRTNVSNLDKKIESIKSILKALSDEEWHKYGELLEKTKISSRTLTNHLDYLKECKLIKREEREYPSAYYKAEPELVTYTEAAFSIEELSQQIEPVLLETKNPSFVLNLIHMNCGAILEITVYKLKEDKNVPEHKLRFLLDLFAWETYRILTWKLVEATKKHIDEIPVEFDLNKLKEKLNELEKLADKLDKEG